MSYKIVKTGVTLFCLGLSGGLSAQETSSFNGTNTGGIPDNSPVGREISFNVDHLGEISDIQLDVNIDHTWVGDLDVSLSAPNGDEHIIFADTGAVSPGAGGDSSNLLGTYVFSDRKPAPVNWWAAAAAISGLEIIPVGNYRTSSESGMDTALTPAFAGHYPAGTWILKVVDEGSGDIGMVNSATLRFTADSLLTTSYAGGNGQAGNFFNLTAKQNDIIIHSIDINIDTGTSNASAYTKKGSYQGFESDAGAWQSIGTASITGITNTPSPFNINDVTIPAGQTQGFLVIMDVTSINYTNGVGEFENNDLSLFSDKGVGIPAFGGGLFTPRFWNGTVHYTTEDSSCFVSVASNGNVITYCL